MPLIRSAMEENFICRRSSSLLIFAVGAGISIYEGIVHIAEPEPLRNPTINYLVLSIAVVLEGTSWTIAVREFNEKRGASSWWQSVRASKDPAGFIVLLEDSAALLGLMIAGLGIWASHNFGDPRIDGAASILIGAILAGVAMLLAREAKGLLIGESADVEIISTVWRMLDQRPEISAVNHVRTIHTAPDAVFVAISADFRDDILLGKAEMLIEEIETALKAAVPSLTSIYIRPEESENATLQQTPPRLQ